MPNTSESTTAVSDSEASKQLNAEKNRTSAVIAGLVTTSLFCTLLWIWVSFDKHAPACDEANHVMNGLTYANLLEHSRLLRASWWHDFFTVNNYYPPVGTLTMGIFIALLKDPIVALQLVKIFWSAVLSISVGFIAFSISGNAIAVASAICLVNLSILTCDFSHSALIDQPLVSMVSAGLATIYWKGGRANVKHSLVSGIVLGIAIMSKQVAIAFLGFPVVLDTLRTVRQNGWKKGLTSLALVVLPIIMLCAPWTILNYGSMQKLNAEIAADLCKRGSAMTRMLFNLKYYIGSWIYTSSPLVSVTALLGFLALSRDEHKRLMPLWAAVIPAAVALCVISCQPARDRYIAPMVILIAVAGGIGLSQLAKRSKPLLLTFLVTFVPLALIQFVSFNFCPYPIERPVWLVNAASVLGSTLREHVSPFFDESNSIVFAKHSSPSKDAGKVATQILDCVEAKDGNLVSWMNITASGGGLDVHELELLAKLRRLAVKPTTSRVWTALGDKEEFSETKALDYRWYIIKDGSQGFRFADEASTRAHDSLIKYIRGHYELIKQIEAADGNSVCVYCVAAEQP